MPDKGFKTLTVTEKVYQKIKSKAKKEKKSVSSYTTNVLSGFIEADEKINQTSPIIEIIGLEGNSAILRDKKLDRIVEVYLHQKELKCMYDNSKDCIHVGFCYALPQIKKIQ